MSRRGQDDHGLTPELLIRAYAAGIFPMAERRDDPAVFWVDTKTRGVLPLDGVHVPRRLQRTVKSGAFFGESMFSLERDASKVALVHLVARLRLGGFRLLDVQFTTDHLKQFGVTEIPARVYLDSLEAALAREAEFPAAADDARVADELDALFRESRNLE